MCPRASVQAATCLWRYERVVLIDCAALVLGLSLLAQFTNYLMDFYSLFLTLEITRQWAVIVSGYFDGKRPVKSIFS